MIKVSKDAYIQGLYVMLYLLKCRGSGHYMITRDKCLDRVETHAQNCRSRVEYYCLVTDFKGEYKGGLLLLERKH